VSFPTDLKLSRRDSCASSGLMGGGDFDKLPSIKLSGIGLLEVKLSGILLTLSGNVGGDFKLDGRL
jgi:hypothetical protein